MDRRMLAGTCERGMGRPSASTGTPHRHRAREIVARRIRSGGGPARCRGDPTSRLPTAGGSSSPSGGKPPSSSSFSGPGAVHTAGRVLWRRPSSSAPFEELRSDAVLDPSRTVLKTPGRSSSLPSAREGSRNDQCKRFLGTAEDRIRLVGAVADSHDVVEGLAEVAPPQRSWPRTGPRTRNPRAGGVVGAQEKDPLATPLFRHLHS
jgi:hypothetical protein